MSFEFWFGLIVGILVFVIVTFLNIWLWKHRLQALADPFPRWLYGLGWLIFIATLISMVAFDVVLIPTSLSGRSSTISLDQTPFLYLSAAFNFLYLYISVLVFYTWVFYEKRFKQK